MPNSRIKKQRGDQCIGKKRYRGYREAQKVMNRADTYLRPYVCDICTHVHLTSHSPRRAI